MFICLNWIRDFVDLPAGFDPRELAERFTCTTAEVEGVEHITCSASGLIAAGSSSVETIPGDKPLFAVQVDLGDQTGGHGNHRRRSQARRSGDLRPAGVHAARHRRRSASGRPPAGPASA